MMKAIFAAGILIASVASAYAASNPQRISGGAVYPVFVNNTGTNQTQADGVYVNQTQYTPAVASAQSRTLLGVGK